MHLKLTTNYYIRTLYNNIEVASYSIVVPLERNNFYPTTCYVLKQLYYHKKMKRLPFAIFSIFKRLINILLYKSIMVKFRIFYKTD